MLTHWQAYELTRLKVKKIQEDIRRHPRNLQKDPRNWLTGGDRGLQLQFKPCIQPPGVESDGYRVGCLMFFNVFWLVSIFCFYQMYMCDSLHQINHDVIIHVLRGILLLFFGNMIHRGREGDCQDAVGNL